MLSWHRAKTANRKHTCEFRGAFLGGCASPSRLPTSEPDNRNSENKTSIGNSQTRSSRRKTSNTKRKSQRPAANPKQRQAQLQAPPLTNLPHQPSKDPFPPIPRPLLPSLPHPPNKKPSDGCTASCRNAVHHGSSQSSASMWGFGAFDSFSHVTYMSQGCSYT